MCVYTAPSIELALSWWQPSLLYIVAASFCRESTFPQLSQSNTRHLGTLRRLKAVFSTSQHKRKCSTVCTTHISPASFLLPSSPLGPYFVSFFLLFSHLHFTFFLLHLSFVFDLPVLTPCPPAALVSLQTWGRSLSETRRPIKLPMP